VLIRMENRILIVYKSTTGFTRKYADIVEEAISCTVMDYRRVTKEMLSDYDTVVYGSRAHAGSIDGYRKMRKLFSQSGAKRLVLFVTGAMPNEEETLIEGFWKQNLPDGEAERIPHFYMQAGLCYERMSCMDKMMMKGFASMLKKKKNKSGEEQAMEKMIAASFDISDRKYAEPLIAYLKGL